MSITIQDKKKMAENKSEIKASVQEIHLLCLLNTCLVSDLFSYFLREIRNIYLYIFSS